MSGKRRKYTPEFREQAARLVIETGRPVAHVAAEIGVGKQVLGRWVRLARAADDAGNTGAVLDADERAELERLRRENAELRLDREFLKKPPSSSPNRTGRGLPVAAESARHQCGGVGLGVGAGERDPAAASGAGSTVLRLPGVEEGMRESNPVGRGRYTPGRSGGRASALVPRMVKLPWIPSEADWLRLLAVFADEPIRNRVTLALAYDAVALENDVREWIATWNADPRPFAWTKTAEEILATPSTNISHAFPARGTSGFGDSQST
jgi:transposase